MLLYLMNMVGVVQRKNNDDNDAKQVAGLKREQAWMADAGNAADRIMTEF